MRDIQFIWTKATAYDMEASSFSYNREIQYLYARMIDATNPSDSPNLSL